MRRSKVPIGRPTYVWIVVVAAVLAVPPFVTAIVYSAVLHANGSEELVLFGISVMFSAFLVAAVRQYGLARYQSQHCDE
jgi:putative effector of murein hydrolase LrgA (UPF0299 family)